MELTPEERRKVYEEEKARIESVGHNRTEVYQNSARHPFVVQALRLWKEDPVSVWVICALVFIVVIVVLSALPTQQSPTSEQETEPVIASAPTNPARAPSPAVSAQVAASTPNRNLSASDRQAIVDYVDGMLGAGDTVNGGLEKSVKAMEEVLANPVLLTNNQWLHRVRDISADIRDAADRLGGATNVPPQLTELNSRMRRAADTAREYAADFSQAMQNQDSSALRLLPDHLNHLTALLHEGQGEIQRLSAIYR